MVTKLKSFFGLLMCFVPIYNAYKLDTSNFNEKFGKDATYYERACLGLSMCNSTIVQPTNIRKGYYKCSCDLDCSMYGDCCPDSPTNKSDDAKVFSCTPKIPFYMVEKCPTSYTDAVTRMKCENISAGVAYEDAKIMRPVTDTKSRVTYLNAYCAVCNNVTDYEKFDLSYRCSRIRTEKEVDEDNIIAKLPLEKVLSEAKFDPQKNIFTAAINGSVYQCHHKVVIPTQLQPYLRDCLPHLISTCPKSFNDSEVIEKCHSSTYYVVYDGVMAGTGDSYRNEYCAKCNGIESVYHCQTLSRRTGSQSLFATSSTGGMCSDPNMQALPVC